MQVALREEHARAAPVLLVVQVVPVLQVLLAVLVLLVVQVPLAAPVVLRSSSGRRRRQVRAVRARQPAAGSSADGSACPVQLCRERVPTPVPALGRVALTRSPVGPWAPLGDDRRRPQGAHGGALQRCCRVAVLGGRAARRWEIRRQRRRRANRSGPHNSAPRTGQPFKYALSAGDSSTRSRRSASVSKPRRSRGRGSRCWPGPRPCQGSHAYLISVRVTPVQGFTPISRVHACHCGRELTSTGVTHEHGEPRPSHSDRGGKHNRWDPPACSDGAPVRGRAKLSPYRNPSTIRATAIATTSQISHRCRPCRTPPVSPP